MSFIQSQYYDVIKKILSLAGQWPYQSSKMRLLCMSLVTLSIFSMIIPQTAKFVICDGDLSCICETLTSYVLTSITLVKLYTCYFNRRKMKTIIDYFFIDRDKLESPEEYEIIKMHVETCRRFSMAYSSYCFISLTLFMCVSFIPQLLDIVSPLNESRPLLAPYPGHYFVDQEEYFLYIFCHSIMAWEISMTGMVAHDCMFLICVEYVCSVFSVTGLRFERLIYEDTIANGSPVYSNNSCKRIMCSVLVHQKALKVAQLLNDIFSLSLAIQVILNTLVITVTLLQISHEKAATLEAMRYVVYVAAQLIHLFSLSFEGQKLIDHSLQTHSKIYNGYWYKLPLKSQKLILLTMMKSLRPCYVSAGKIYIFSLEGFTTIIRASVSYFTMLASFQ